MNQINKDQVTIRNGDIIIAFNKVFMVTSYIADKDSCVDVEKYCSMVDLRTGGKAFPEPCTRRNTSYVRIVSHLKRACSSLTAMDIMIIPKEKYDISISLITDQTD